MRKFFLLLMVGLSIGLTDYGQTPDSTKALPDSIAILNDLMALLKGEDAASSYFTITAGIGNRLYSFRNNSLNAKQSSSNTIIYSPSIAYYHKSGFSLSGGANLLNDAKDGFGVNQYSVSPGYQYNNKNYTTGISYTHYFVRDKYSAYASPIQNDLYASFSWTKPWIQPGIAVGYSTGKYYDHIIFGQQQQYYDSTTNKLKSFSVIASAAHGFDWYNLFDQSDGIIVTPTLMGNFGSSKTDIQHNSNAPNLINFLTNRGRLRKFTTNKFQAESIGLDIDVNYVIGKFNIEPDLYLDYYLPSTDTKRFTQVYTVKVGYSF